MLIALTGTPGTGKSSVARFLRKKGYRVISLNRIIVREKMVKSCDEKRKSWIVDMKRLEKYVENLKKKYPEKTIILDSHISHLLPVDFVIVLHCSPDELEKRLKKKRWRKEKIRENVEAEMIEVIAVEAEEMLGKERVVEIDTTSKTPEEVCKEIIEVLGKLHY